MHENKKESYESERILTKRKKMRKPKKTAKTPQKRGEQATELVFQAALDLADRFGLEAVTIEGLASHLGIAKTTIYRRWPNVSTLLTDAILSEVTKMAPLRELGTVRETFEASMKRLVALYTSSRGAVLRSLIGRAQQDEKLVKQIEDRWVEPRREIARGFLRNAASRGEIAPDSDPDVILDCLYGPIYHRLLVPYRNSVMNDLFVDRVLDTVFGHISRVSEKRPSKGEPGKA
jgi:AcrR family transcriptional regulator